MKVEKIRDLIATMTLEEKAGMCSGSDFWHTKGVKRLGIPKSMVSDGPHGLRKQDLEADHLGINESIKAVCFPSGCGAAATFNRELLTAMGEALGNECQAEGVSVILGPAVNIKRSPLCGRNFEYYSEDPYLATEIATSHIKGVQSKQVGTSIKHFLANNQEHRRMTSDSRIDERTMREIYLAAFEGAVKNAKPWTVMCSYNKVNGTYAAENKTLLTDILRTEWGFDGYVVSDWGAVNERVEGLRAGLELEMPSSDGVNDKAIVEAVKRGELEESILDTAVERILNIIYRFEENRDMTAVFDRDKDHELSGTVAEESMVLLKNDNILPLNENDNIAFIGKFAEKPRFQGGGSSHINSHKVTTVLDMVKGMDHIIYAKGYDDKEDCTDEVLLQEAIEAAKKSKVAVIFAGLPDAFESEGFDRLHMRMPNCQNRLIEEVTKVQPQTIVVLHNGSPVEMPWINQVKGVLEAYLGGQAVGSAIYNILFGKVNPSGRLAETFPLKLEDNPSYLYYLGEEDVTEYREGVFVGYRYYDKKKMEVLFPFGYGQSYTTFQYSDLNLSKKEMTDIDTLTVTVTVENTGHMEGKEVVQLYVADRESTVIRPVRELKEFAKVSLKPGEKKTVSFTLSKRAFSYYNIAIRDWHVETGEFEIQIGKSSRDIILTEVVKVNSTVTLPRTYHMNTTLGDILADEKASKIAAPLIEAYLAVNAPKEEEGLGEASKAMMDAMFQNTPIRAILNFGAGNFTKEQLEGYIEQLNQ